MKKFIVLIATFGLTVLAAANAAGAYSIAPDQIDDQQIYFGDAKSFEKPAKVDYTAVVKATPEYEEIKKKKIDSSCAKYWILMSSASDHAVKLISEVGEESEHDLIVSIGYLGKITPSFEAEDVTKKVLEKLEPQKPASKNAKPSKSSRNKGR
jgi:hypothetical protein